MDAVSIRPSSSTERTLGHATLRPSFLPVFKHGEDAQPRDSLFIISPSADPSQKLPRPLIVAWSLPIVDPLQRRSYTWPVRPSSCRMCLPPSVSLLPILADSSCLFCCQSRLVRGFIRPCLVAPERPCFHLLPSFVRVQFSKFH